MLGSTMTQIPVAEQAKLTPPCEAVVSPQTLSMNGRSRVYVSSHGFSSEPSVLGS
jgi:hypothetical protein